MCAALAPANEGAFASVALASSCVFMAYRSVLRMNDVEVSARRLADSGAEIPLRVLRQPLPS